MDPHSFSKLDLDPHSLKKLDPDSHKVQTDQKHRIFRILPGLLIFKKSLNQNFLNTVNACFAELFAS
jgi:hypothetical protein